MLEFVNRHIGIKASDLDEMLSAVGVSSLAEMMERTVPSDIRLNNELDIPEALTERNYLKEIRYTAQKNKVYRSYIGQGYFGTVTPPVIQRNVFENPGWYTQYTPYQAEIAQGRLEALLNFQTVVSELTGLPIANASLLDEGTAAAEAMAMFYGIKNKRNKDSKVKRIFVDRSVFPQTLAVLKSRAKPLQIEIVSADYRSIRLNHEYFAALVQQPNAAGSVEDYRDFVTRCKENGIYTIVAADILSLVLLDAPGAWGVDCVVGNTQRFGVPMGFGGPHAAYFATHEEYKRVIPGRIIGVSQDSRGKEALRMALQTREQHIKRERATSNICTAQALLAIMAGFYAVYHGPDGLKEIATEVHQRTKALATTLEGLGLKQRNRQYFDTLCIEADDNLLSTVETIAERRAINFLFTPDAIQLSIDETAGDADIQDIAAIFAEAVRKDQPVVPANNGFAIDPEHRRNSEILAHPTFHAYNSETEMMRYIKHLENKDLSLVHSMIPLGSCTMKLNAAAQLMPVGMHAFAHLHPFAPPTQTRAYQKIFRELEDYLCEITGFQGCSLMPNSGAQGELTGLLTICAYHEANNENHRNITLIPSSAHGTNPASAVMAGTKVVVVKCDDLGNIDVDDLREKAIAHRDQLAALMVTYPSTHGVFEKTIREVCQIIHENGGLVYMDGANMNAQVGYTNPALIGADVCHLNLHKTFSIPHGGGGPGMGPICVNDKLKPFLPNHPLADVGGNQGIDAVGAAPWGSASILLISYAYIKMLGRTGLKAATEYAILNANYLCAKLSNDFSILYTGENGMVAHEFIIDLREYKTIGISAEDVAKRLIDYGFHAPTLSFPVAGTIMIEPTESESKAELDRFCEAMLSIKQEIDEVARGDADPKNNVLVNAPHTVDMLTDANWKFPYAREKAVFPLPWLYHTHKFWPSVSRIDNAYGDRHLICTCPPIESYMDQPAEFEA